jgi:signal transduction histidine kinase/CheY-like chemotaxis protein
MLKKDGSVGWLRDVVMVTMKNGVPHTLQGYLLDITDKVINEKKLTDQNIELIEVGKALKNRNELLFNTKSRFKSLFEQNPISLWEEDLNDFFELINSKIEDVEDIEKYIYENDKFVLDCIKCVKVINVNQAALMLFDLTEKSELIEHLGVTFNENSLQVFRKEIIALALGATNFRSETEFVKRNGEIIHSIINLEVLPESKRAIVSIIDVTDLKISERLLLKAKEHAEESDRLKSEFLSNISHEIRTPLNGIIGFSSFLEEPDISDKMRAQYVSIVKNSGSQLIRIIDDILEMSKLNIKVDQLKMGEVCINTLLFELGSIFNLIALEKGLTFNVEFDINPEESWVRTDETKLTKILSNIFQNAFKFTQTGSVNVSYRFIKNSIEFKIADTGIGINENKLDHVFKRFVQEDAAIASDYGGLGLGLSIVKEHVDLLQGNISVQSKKGEGSTFLINIPHYPITKKINTVLEKNLNALEPIQEGIVLMVEDDAVNALLMNRYLENSHIFKEVIHAVNGREAIDFCESRKDIDIVLMDIGIPIINGFDATREIKRMRPDLPVIAQTAYSTAEDREKIMNAGCDDFISKPIFYPDLIPLLAKFMQVAT